MTLLTFLQNFGQKLKDKWAQQNKRKCNALACIRPFLASLGNISELLFIVLFLCSLERKLLATIPEKSLTPSYKHVP